MTARWSPIFRWKKPATICSAMKAHKLAPVFLAAPTSTDQRLRDVAKHSRGFVYAISRTGITGTRQEVAGDARSLVERLRAYTKLPIAVGFGVSTPEQFAEVGSFADAAVVGSAIVQRSNRIRDGKRRLCQNSCLPLTGTARKRAGRS